MRLLTLIAADGWTCRLLLVLLLLLAADCVQNPTDAALLLLSCGLLAVRATLVLVPKNRAQDSGRQLARILAAGQQIVQLHLGNLLHVRRNLRMLERSGDDHRQHKFALIIGKRRVHETTNLRASDLLADGFVEHGRYMQIQRLIGQVDQAGSGHRAAINHSFQIICLGKAILHIEISGELDQISKAFRRPKTIAHEFTY